MGSQKNFEIPQEPEYELRVENDGTCSLTIRYVPPQRYQLPEGWEIVAATPTPENTVIKVEPRSVSASPENEHNETR